MLRPASTPVEGQAVSAGPRPAPFPARLGHIVGRRRRIPGFAQTGIAINHCDQRGYLRGRLPQQTKHLGDDPGMQWELNTNTQELRAAAKPRFSDLL